jgi:hypothetical protein
MNSTWLFEPGEVPALVELVPVAECRLLGTVMLYVLASMNRRLVRAPVLGSFKQLQSGSEVLRRTWFVASEDVLRASIAVGPRTKLIYDPGAEHRR